MKLLALGRARDGADTREQIARHAKEEMQRLWELYRAGTVREMYSPTGPGAVLVLETAARINAVEVLEGLPLVKAGVVEFEVIELHPFAAFQILFAAREAE
jgi:hypothetical protein